MKKILIFAFAVCLVLSLFSCAKQEKGSPTGMKKASPENCGYYLYVPSTWVIDTKSNELLTAAHVSETNLSNVSMANYSNEDGVSLQDFWKTYKPSVEAMIDKNTDGNSTFELVTDAETTLIDGKESIRCLYSGTLGGVELKYLQVFTAYNSNVYIFTYTAYVSRFDKDLPNVETILKNIVFDEKA